MLRELIVSFISHIIVFGSLLYASTFGEKPIIQQFDYYRVKTVTPQSISELLKKTGDVSKPKPEIPQIQTKTKTLPKEHRKSSQTVKRSTVKTSVSKEKSESTDLKGIRTDSEFDFPEYLLELRDRIEQNWLPPSSMETLSTTVFFRIGRDGKIVRVFVEKPTQNIRFDASAQKAVIACDPFSPLPDGFKNDNLGVHFEFIYEN